MGTISRRGFVGGSLSGVALGLPVAGLAQATPSDRRLKVVVAGAHPDDPESAAGGTMARYSDLGHEVVSLYLTRGEAGIRGKTHEQSATIRTGEAEQACKILKARPVFAGQIDGGTEVNAARYDEFRKLLESERPDVVFTHWPIDTHRDHRAVSLLTYDAWLKMGRSFALYFFEVMTGTQTQVFRPTHYVDITAAEQRKRDACFAHVSQDPRHFYDMHDAMNRFRGMEHGCKFAEAFVHEDQGPAGILPADPSATSRE
jgi:LmbE family N-acetylglucosaminyl deacetylase